MRALCRSPRLLRLVGWALSAVASLTFIAASSGSDAPAPAKLVRVFVADPSTALFERRPEPDLEAYGAAMFLEPELRYGPTSDHWTSRQESALRSSFIHSLQKAFAAERGWKRAEEPGGDVVAVAVSVAEVAHKGPRGPDASAATSYVAASEPMLLQVEIRDSRTGDPLVRVVSRRRMRAGIYEGNDVNLRRVQQTFERFARDASGYLGRDASDAD